MKRENKVVNQRNNAPINFSSLQPCRKLLLLTEKQALFHLLSVPQTGKKRLRQAAFNLVTTFYDGLCR